MAASRGVKQLLRIGTTNVPVQLVNMAQKSPEAQYETKRVERDDAPEPVAVEAESPAGDSWPDSVAGEVRDVFAPEPEPEPAPVSRGGFTPLPGDGDEPAEEPAVRIERGVHGPGGAWVDCTDQLAAIDTDTRLEAMQVEFTVATNHVPRERVTGAHYLAPAGEGAPGVLVALWFALKADQAAAIVRWTKRTNQALGAIVARGREGHEHLALLELAWPEQVRDLEARCNLSTLIELTDADSASVLAARDYVAAMREGPAMFTEVHDERTRQRIELLEAAREGRTWTAPKPVEVEVPEVAALDRALADAA